MDQARQEFQIGPKDGTHFTLRIEPNDFGGIRLLAIGPQGDARFAEIKYGGGHLEIAFPANLPDGTGLELDAGRHALVHYE